MRSLSAASLAVLCAAGTASADVNSYAVPFQFGANNGAAVVQLPQF